MPGPDGSHLAILRARHASPPGRARKRWAVQARSPWRLKQLFKTIKSKITLDKYLGGVLYFSVPRPQHQKFPSNAVPTVRERVVVTAGKQLIGRGVWQLSDGSIDGNGVFSDFYSTNGNDPSYVNQRYSATGNPANLIVNIGETPNQMQYQILSNYYSRSTVTVAGTTAPRACQPGVDPW
jgi:hypothetical protein